MYEAWEHPGLLVKHFSLRNHATQSSRVLRRVRVRRGWAGDGVRSLACFLR